MKIQGLVAVTDNSGHVSKSRFEGDLDFQVEHFDVIIQKMRTHGTIVSFVASGSGSEFCLPDPPVPWDQALPLSVLIHQNNAQCALGKDVYKLENIWTWINLLSIYINPIHGVGTKLFIYDVAAKGPNRFLHDQMIDWENIQKIHITITV